MELVAKEFCGNQKNKLILKGIRQINQGCQALSKALNCCLPELNEYAKSMFTLHSSYFFY